MACVEKDKDQSWNQGERKKKEGRNKALFHEVLVFKAEETQPSVPPQKLHRVKDQKENDWTDDLDKAYLKINFSIRRGDLVDVMAFEIDLWTKPLNLVIDEETRVSHALCVHQHVLVVAEDEIAVRIVVLQPIDAIDILIDGFDRDRRIDSSFPSIGKIKNAFQTKVIICSKLLRDPDLICSQVWIPLHEGREGKGTPVFLHEGIGRQEAAGIRRFRFLLGIDADLGTEVIIFLRRIQGNVGQDELIERDGMIRIDDGPVPFEARKEKKGGEKLSQDQEQKKDISERIEKLGLEEKKHQINLSSSAW